MGHSLGLGLHGTSHTPHQSAASRDRAWSVRRNRGLAASGFRSSCDASATNCRTLVSDAWRAASASSTLLSMWLMPGPPVRPQGRIGIRWRHAYCKGHLATIELQLGYLLRGRSLPDSAGAGCGQRGAGRERGAHDDQQRKTVQQERPTPGWSGRSAAAVRRPPEWRALLIRQRFGRQPLDSGRDRRGQWSSSFRRSVHRVGKQPRPEALIAAADQAPRSVSMPSSSGVPSLAYSTASVPIGCPGRSKPLSAPPAGKVLAGSRTRAITASSWRSSWDISTWRWPTPSQW